MVDSTKKMHAGRRHRARMTACLARGFALTLVCSAPLMVCDLSRLLTFFYLKYLLFILGRLFEKETEQDVQDVQPAQTGHGNLCNGTFVVRCDVVFGDAASQFCCDCRTASGPEHIDIQKKEKSAVTVALAAAGSTSTNAMTQKTSHATTPVSPKDISCWPSCADPEKLLTEAHVPVQSEGVTSTPKSAANSVTNTSTRALLATPLQSCSLGETFGLFAGVFLGVFFYNFSTIQQGLRDTQFFCNLVFSEEHESARVAVRCFPRMHTRVCVCGCVGVFSFFVLQCGQHKRQ